MILKAKHKALVFDSGVGGLSVVRELRRLMPDIYLNYVADDGFRPYGNKTEAALKARLPGLIQTLVFATQPDVVVIACNTASTTALAEIRAVVKLPVIGVVPAIKPAALSSSRKAIAVLGTPGTVRRKYVGKLIRDFASDCQIVLHGSTGLVDMAERKLAGLPVDLEALRAEIFPLFADVRIDTVVLACTHFPLLLGELRSVAPYDVNWIDSGSAIAKRAQSVLQDLRPGIVPDWPQTALLVGGQDDETRAGMFASFGFTKTVSL